MTRCVGIDLDPVAPSMSAAGAALEGYGLAALNQFPLALVKPVTRGEPLVLDRRWPASSRGSGLDAGRDPSSQRMPLAFLWQALALGVNSRLNFGDTDIVGRGMAFGEALGFSAAQLACDLGNAGGELELALVVPNSIDEFAQEGLLRGLHQEARRQGLGRVRAGLLWRPVAATLAWLSRHTDSVAWRNRQPMQSVGCVLHLHLAIEGCEFTWVDLVPFQEDGGDLVLLPGRRRPSSVDALSLQPLAALESTLDSALIGKVPDAEVRRRMAWHAAWMSPLLPSAGLARDPSGVEEAATLAPVAFLRDALAGELLGSLEIRHPASGWTGAWLGPPEVTLSEWLGCVSRDDKVRCVGVVVSGNLARRRIASGETLAGELLKRFALPFGVPAEFDAEGGPSLLAQGAESFAARRRQGLAAYLDSLPGVDMICMRDGEPLWVNLLDIGQRWAVGGRKTEFEPKGARFLIRKGQPELRITVHREGAATCRSVAAALGSRPDVDVPVRMKVAIDPGQGNPRVELLPDDARCLRGRALVLDWDTAKDTGKDRDTELRETLRGYPPPLVRGADQSRWSEAVFYKDGYTECKGVHGLIWHFLTHPMDLANRDLVRYLVAHIVKLQEGSGYGKAGGSHSEDPPGAAVSSEGRLHADVSGQRVLEQLKRQAIKQAGNPEGSVAACGFRILGALCCDDKQARAVIMKRLTAPGVAGVDKSIRGALLAAAGSCLREPFEFERLFEFVDRSLGGVPNQTASYQLAECIRQVCRHRKDALEHVSSARVEHWIIWLVAQLRSAPMRNSVRPIHARATEAIAYLLRRRFYDRSCVDGGSDVYWHVRRGMRNMFRGVSRRASDGVRKALEEMRRVRRYVGWQGFGNVEIKADDDD